MTCILSCLILFSLCGAGFNSDGSNEGMIYRVKVKGSYKSSWDVQRLAEWEALTFCRPEGPRAWNSVTTAGAMGKRAISRSCRQGRLQLLVSHSAEAERGQWINTPNSLSSCPLISSSFETLAKLNQKPANHQGWSNEANYKGGRREAENEWWYEAGGN